MSRIVLTSHHCFAFRDLLQLVVLPFIGISQLWGIVVMPQYITWVYS